MLMPFATDVHVGIIHVGRLDHKTRNSLTILAMLRGDSVFVDGGVELLRNGGETWLGFSKFVNHSDAQCCS
jgi:hypothetical protein